jgi:hypothetical protein
MANNRVILQAGSFAGAILGTYDIFGSNAGSETVTVFDNTIANFQGDFARGGDIIRLNDTATDFTVRISGSNVEIFSASAGITALVPVGIAGTTIGFQTGTNTFTDTRTLIFDGTNVVLGGQVITGTAAAINPVAPPAGPEISGLISLDDAVALPPPAGPEIANLKEIEIPQAAAFAVSEPAVVHFSAPEPVTIDYKAAFELGMTSAVIHFA